MKKHRKILSMILCAAILLMCQPGQFSYAAQLYTYGDFTYTKTNNEATIVDCDMSGGRLTVPSRLDSYSVTAIGAFAFMNKGYVGVTLPKTIKSIGNGAFMYCDGLTKVTIPNGVLSMGDNVFYGCTQLDEITIPASVEYIGIDAFENCASELVIVGFTGSYAEDYASEYGYGFESLGESEQMAVASGVCGENVTWSLSALGVLTVAGSGEMYVESGNTYWRAYTNNIKSIVVEEGITSIMNSAFMGCTEAEVVSIPSTIEKIGRDAFSSCTKIKSIDIKQGVKEIGSSAFYNCSSLVRIVLPDSVTKIGSSAFERCSALKLAVLPKDIKTIEDETFFWCEALRSVVLPEKLKSIGVYAFSCCFALSEIELNDRLTTIHESAFSRCTFAEISFPPSVSTIHESAFSGIEPAPVLKGYDGSSVQSYAEEYGFTFESLGEMPVAVIEEGEFADSLSWSMNTLGHLVISGVGASCDFYASSPAPWSSYTVNSIEIEDGITYIGKNMFNGLEKITEVSIPGTVKEIAAASFGGCSALSAITIPEGVTDIHSSAFAGCATLSEITIPSSVIYIATETYETRDAFSGCAEGFTICGYEKSAAQIYADTEGYAFKNLGTVASCEVKSGTYTDTNNGTVISYSLTNDGIMTVDASQAYTIGRSYNLPWYNWYAVRELVLGEHIQGLSSNAFEYQSNLVKVSFPETILEIDSYAFGNRTLNFEVCGYDNTAAQTFAENKNLTYTSLGEATIEIVIASGTAGDSSTWELNNFGVLTVKGTGNMYDYSRPWDDYREKIREIVIEPGVNSVGSGAFEYAYNATKITVSYTVIRMGSFCIHNNMTVYGYDGGVAKKYADDRAIPFVSLGAPPPNELIVEASRCGDDAFWSLTSDGLLTIYGNGAVNESGWYDLKSMITKVVVEEGITSITAYYAFELCENLTEVTIADSVTYMNGYTFSNCPKLEKVQLSKSAPIPYEAFSYCSALEEVIIPSGVQSIGGMAFYGCTSLKNVTIPTSVTSITSSAFSDCHPDFTITGFAGSAAETYAKQYSKPFNSLGTAPLEQEQSGTTGALSWKLTTDNTFIVSGNGAMADYSWYSSLPWENYKKYINKIVFEEGVTKVGAYAFEDCENIESISFPSTLKEIAHDAFSYSSMPKKLELPNGLEYIGSSAFYGCSGLSEVVIPETVQQIDYSFSGYGNNFVISGMTGSKAEKYAKENGYTFNSLGFMERKILDAGMCGETLEYTFDNYAQLTINGWGWMYDYEEGETPWDPSKIETLRMSDDVEYIGDCAFMGAYNLKDVQLSENLIQIGDYAFYGCHQMPFLVLPESLESIDDYAFADGGKGLVIPWNVTFIGKNAFTYRTVYVDQGSYAEEYCKNQPQDSWMDWFYTSVSGQAGDNISWSLDIASGLLEFDGHGQMYDYVNYESYNMSTAPWYRYMNTVSEIKLSEGITYIGAGALQNITIPETVKLPSTIEDIGDYAFMSARIKNLTIPEGCYSIGNGAFFDNWKMEKIVIPASVEIIGNEAFDYCDELTIYTPAGSVAWDYANSRNRPVIAIVESKFLAAFAFVDTYYNSIQVIIEGQGLDNGKIFCATYDADGRFLQMLPYGEPLLAQSVASVRCFMWEDLDTMVPLCEPIDAKLKSAGGGGPGGGGAGGGGADGGGTSGGVVVPDFDNENILSVHEATMEVEQ